MDLNDPRTASTTNKSRATEDAQRWHHARQTATRVVCSHAHDATDARDLLDMLGLDPTDTAKSGRAHDTETDTVTPAPTVSSALLALGYPS